MLRKFALGTSVLALLLLAGCNQNTASNQGGQPADVTENAPQENVAENAPTDPTEALVQNVALIDMYEVQAGQIAAMRSPSDDVKQFGKQMVDAHTQHLNELKKLIAKDMPQYKPPMQLDQTHQALLDDLQAATDQQFDPRYIAQQIDQHNQALYQMRMYMKQGDNPDIKAFAQQSAPIVTMHLQAINAIDRAHHLPRVAQQTNNTGQRTR
jgi:putative membrane protein